MSELKSSSTQLYQNGPINTSSSAGLGTTNGGTIYQNGPINTSNGTGLDTSGFIMTPTKPVNPTGYGSVKIKYDAVIDICENMIAIANELNDQWEIINNIINTRDEYWRGEAADRFFDDIKTSYNVVSEITSADQMLKYISKVKELVEENKKTDTIISENDITKINEMLPTFSFLKVGTVSDGIDQEKLDAVHTNSNVGSENVGTVSDGIDNDLLNNTHTNSNVGSQTTGTVSDGIDNDLLNSVNVDDKVNSAGDAGQVSSGADEALFNSVKTADAALEAQIVQDSLDASTTADSLTGSINAINNEANK